MYGQFHRYFEEKADIEIIKRTNQYKFLGVEQVDGIRKEQVLPNVEFETRDTIMRLFHHQLYNLIHELQSNPSCWILL